MKKSLRVISFATAAILAVGVMFTSCTPGGKTSSTTSGVKYTDVKTAADIKFTNPSLSIMGYQGTEDWLQPLIENFKALGGAAPSCIYPVWEQRHQQLSTKISTNASPDLYKYEEGSGDWPNLITAAQVESVDNLIDYNSPLFAPLKSAFDAYKIGGKGYLIPNSIQCFRSFVLYNKTVFQNAGLETPFQLYQKGEWTMDKMEEYAQKFTVTTGGTQTSIGMYCSDEGPFIASTGRDFIQADASGNIVNNVKDPIIAKMMERIQRMYRDEKCLTMDASIARTMMVNGKMAMYAGAFQNIDTLGLLPSTGVIEWVPFPKDPDADKWYLDGKVDGYFIPRGAKNVDGALAWNAMATQYNQDPSIIDSQAAAQAAKYHVTADFGTINKEMVHNSSKFAIKILLYKNFTTFYSKFYDAYWNKLIQGTSWSTIAEQLSPVADQEIQKLSATN